MLFEFEKENLLYFSFFVFIFDVLFDGIFFFENFLKCCLVNIKRREKFFILREVFVVVEMFE